MDYGAADEFNRCDILVTAISFGNYMNIRKWR